MEDIDVRAILTKHGLLNSGVDVVIEEPRAQLVSEIRRIRADGTSYILKSRHPRQPDGPTGQREVAFYHLIPNNPLLPRCYGADWSDRFWYILLEDLSETHHVATEWPLPPDRAQCEAIITALAQFHAAWWDHPQLRVSIGAPIQPILIRNYLTEMTARYAKFATFMGDRLSATQRNMYDRFLAAAPTVMLERLQSRRNNWTILQVDAHMWNYFLPVDPAMHGVKIFDWDSWEVGIPTRDLTYMMALHWFPDMRAERENALLDLYWETLVHNGVSTYERTALQEDYTMSALGHLLAPLWQASDGRIPARIWWNNLQRICFAIGDLGSLRCLERLGSTTSYGNVSPSNTTARPPKQGISG